MSSLLDIEGEEKDGQDSEITLTTTSLLGIFFGLVMICAVFFGFGYSLGRGGSRAASAAGTNAAAENTTAENPTDDTGPQPVAQQNQKTPPDLQPQESNASSSSATDNASTAESSTPTQTVTLPLSPEESQSAAQPAPIDRPANRPVHSMEAEDSAATQEPAASPRTAAKTLGAPVKPINAAMAAGGRTMVQIAAVSRQEDADALVAALRQHGFNVVVLGEPQDKLLHVQVGPFSSRAEANSMRQKLLSSGYNAILKQ